MKTKDENDKYEKELVESVLKDFEERQPERKTFESNWQLNINFFLGNQYSQFLFLKVMQMRCCKLCLCVE